MTISQINRKAWAIRRNAAERFGCPVMEISWRICFIDARKELEMGDRMATKIAELKNLGGNEWKRGEYHRIYFNLDTRMDAIGLSVRRYNTGNVSSASLNGERISNNQAKKMISRLGGKFWYDVTTGEFAWKDIDSDLAEEIIDHLIAA